MKNSLPLFSLIGDDIFEVKNTFKTITIRWPTGSKMLTIRGNWKRLSDGRIEATYTRDELALCLSLFELIDEV